VLLAVVVETSQSVTATRSRTAKIDSLATLLTECTPDEVGTVVCMLTGEPRQGRIGVGWSTLSTVRDEAVLRKGSGASAVTVAEFDDALDRIATTTGSGSAAVRQEILAEVFARATLAEADFVVRLLTGELRQGALAGLMADAIARAARVPPAAVRRAAMLGGDLGETARRALEGGEGALADVRLEGLPPVQPTLAPRIPFASSGKPISATRWMTSSTRASGTLEMMKFCRRARRMSPPNSAARSAIWMVCSPVTCPRNTGNPM